MLTEASLGRVEQAFEAVDRRNFVLPEYKDIADVDEALPIGYGQTISQPTTVRLMLEWLDVRPGHKVLDVGSGSGWTTALLAQLVGGRGHVYAVERGEENCRRAGRKNVSFFQAGDMVGLPDKAPFDRILVSAAADAIPAALCEQVAIEGKLVIPVHDTIFQLTRANNVNSVRQTTD
jgi:protein-L-isoaspartate(D-aspartate) O-methyltransferase